jgi:hypothetical protein
MLPCPLEEALQRKGAEEVHRDHLRRLERLQHFHHALEIERHIAVDRYRR